MPIRMAGLNSMFLLRLSLRRSLIGLRKVCLAIVARAHPSVGNIRHNVLSRLLAEAGYRIENDSVGDSAPNCNGIAVPLDIIDAKYGCLLELHVLDTSSGQNVDCIFGSAPTRRGTIFIFRSKFFILSRGSGSPGGP
jgi:hypothetical protein